MDQRRISVTLIFLVLVGTLPGLPAQAQDVIGLTAYARGTVSAQYTGGDIRLLGRGADIFTHDVVTTGASSYAIVNLHNKSQVSVRPDSVISMDDYSEKPGKPSVTMRLFKGGMRSISGYLAEHKAESIKVNTRVGQITMKGGKLDARLCEQGECQHEAGTIVAQRKSVSKVGGRVAHKRNQLSATDKRGKVRQLEQGARVVGGDTVATGPQSYALLAFIDGTRATLKENSEFFIEDYNYDKKDPSKSKATLKLVKGGLRTLTGSIGHDNPAAFKVKTAVATIGIRGTGFDLVWLGPCTGSATNCGLIVYVWKGEITSENDAGKFVIGLKRVARIRDKSSPPEFITLPPVFTEPRPDKEDIDEDKLFEQDTGQASSTKQGEKEQKQEALPPGLYVACEDGDCSLSLGGKTLILKAGQMGYVSFKDAKLSSPQTIDPMFTNDSYFNLIEEGRSGETTLYELFDTNVTAQNEVSCNVKGN